MATFTELKTSSSEPAVLSTESTSGAGIGLSASGATALSHMAGLVPSLDAVKSKLGEVWDRSRSWSEFANTQQMNKPEMSELPERIRENLEYYMFNYLVILLVMSALTILTSPLAFLGGIFIVLAYFYLFFLNPEAIKVAGLTLENNAKAALIMVFSLVVLWLTGAGAAFTGLVVVVAVIAVTHAALRKPPGEADFETAYTPATV